MKMVFFTILLLLSCMQFSYAQSAYNHLRVNNMQEEFEGYDRATKKAYDKMKKAQAEYKKQMLKYKKKHMQERDRQRKELRENLNSFKKEMRNTMSAISEGNVFNQITGAVSEGFSTLFDSIDNKTYGMDTNTISRDYDLKDFTSIKCGGLGQIVFTQGNEFKVRAESSEGNLNNLILEVKNGTLVIKLKDLTNYIMSNAYVLGIKIYISAPQLKSVDLDGFSSFTAEELQGDDFNLSTTGVSSVKCDLLKYKNFASTVSGSSRLNVMFEGDKADIVNSGVSNYNLKVDCKELKVDNSGVGVMKISGTADKTDINSSGVSKMDIMELNKY